MRKEEIQELIRIVEESGIAELEVKEGRRSIRISKKASALPRRLHIPSRLSYPQPLASAPPGRSRRCQPRRGEAGIKLETGNITHGRYVLPCAGAGL